MCPAVSKAQQKFFNAVHAVQKGDIKPSEVSKSVRDVAKNMSQKSAKDYAETPTKGLPKKVKKEAIEKIIENIVRKVINETRSKDIEYLVVEAKNGGGKVIAELHKQKAGYVNKIISQYEEIVTELNRLKTLKEGIDPQIKEYIANIFDKEDDLYTRVIETNKMIITLSKESQRRDFKMDTFLKQLEESGLTKDIIDSVKKMIDTSYKIAKVSPSLKGELKKQNEASIVSKLIDWVKNFIHGVNSFIGNENSKMSKKINSLQHTANQLMK